MYNLSCIIKSHMEGSVDLHSESSGFHSIHKDTESMKP